MILPNCPSRPARCHLGDAAVKLCKAVHELWDRFEAETIDRPTLQKETEKLRRQRKKLLKRGRNPESSGRAFCKKLLRLEPAMWTFASVKGIEPTNNLAERMLRPAVMWRKQSFGSHSIEGCRFVERALTAVQTLRLTGRSVMDFFEQAIHAFRHGLSPPKLIAA